jgi:peptide/nickel transport system ATP-binding protein
VTTGVPILAAEGLSKRFPLRNARLFAGQARHVQAVDQVSLTLAPGETLGIVGESGSGKSTLARLLMRLLEPDAGRILIDGVEIDGRALSLRGLRRQVQMVFQDSYASLNPRHTALEEVSFGLIAQGISRSLANARAADTLALVGLEPRLFADRYPHELSGGQRQRVNIARALALGPRILILDEAVSALDKSIEAQVLNLLAEVRARLRLSYVFISHDLSVVRFISDRVLVMYLGRVAELGPTAALYRDPSHPYTRALIASRLSMDPNRRIRIAPISGDPPSPTHPPSGCRFRTRCPLAEPICAVSAPALTRVNGDVLHLSACHAVAPQSGHSQAALAPAG